jgi:gas vesicle protein
MSCEDKSSFGVFLVGFLSGAALGAGLALLFAPQSGKETREKIKDVASDVKDKISDLVDDTKDFISEQKRALKDAVEAGKEAIKKAYEGQE